MQIKKTLLMRLRALKARQRYWNGPQQQLYTALENKRGLWSVRCCPKCLEEVLDRQTLYHACGELVVEVQIKELKKVPGDYVSAWE